MTQISDAQREHLSAYLDGALPDHERIALEQRLQDEPALAEELRELQITAALLRDLPVIAPPRTFTLDPAAYGRRRGFFSWRWTSLAATIGALALFLTVGLSLSLGGSQSPATESAGSSGGAAPNALQLPVAQGAPTSAPTEALAMAEAARATEPPPTEAAMADMGVAVSTASPAGADTLGSGMTIPGAAADPAPPMAGSSAAAGDEPTTTFRMADPYASGNYTGSFSISEIPSGTAMYGTVDTDTAAKLVPPSDLQLTLTPEGDEDMLSAPLSPAQPGPAAAPPEPSLWPIFAAILALGVAGAAAVTLVSRRFDRRR